MRKISPAIYFIAVVSLAVVSLAVAAAPPPAGGASPHAPDPATFACSLPPLGHGTAHPERGSSALRTSASSTSASSGPAVSALTGGAARHGFTLDGQGLVLQPSGRHGRPRLSEHEALCAAMASGMSGSAATGVAAGYGLVSIGTRFFPLAVLGSPGTFPVIHRFHDILAWLVVEHHDVGAYSCPAERVPVRPVAPLPSYHAYQVFVMNASSGRDALIYDEGGGPPPCGFGRRTDPSVSEATERVSVPWTLVSRNPDGYSGTVRAMVPPCAGYTHVILVTQGTDDVGVIVDQPVGPSCGPAAPVMLTLHAAVVTADLPTSIVHDPIGLVTGGPATAPSVGPTTAPSVGPTTAPTTTAPTTTAPTTTAPTTTAPTTTTTAPALITVGPSDNGHTIEMTVGQVLTVPPLPGAHGLTTTTSPVTSNNPEVLGPLSPAPQPLVAELRAWEIGTATVTVPESACKNPGSGQVPCDRPFVVHVVVQAGATP